MTVNPSEKGSHRDRECYDKNFNFMPRGGLRARRLVGPGRGGAGLTHICVSERAHMRVAMGISVGGFSVRVHECVFVCDCAVLTVCECVYGCFRQ